MIHEINIENAYLILNSKFESLKCSRHFVKYFIDSNSIKNIPKKEKLLPYLFAYEEIGQRSIK